MWEQTRKLISTLLYPCLSELNIVVYNRTPELVQLPHSFLDRNITPDMVRYLSNHSDKIYANNTRLIEWLSQFKLNWKEEIDYTYLEYSIKLLWSIDSVCYNSVIGMIIVVAIITLNQTM